MCCSSEECVSVPPVCATSPTPPYTQPHAGRRRCSSTALYSTLLLCMCARDIGHWHRAILAEVRAAQPFRPTKPSALHTVTRSSSRTPAAGVTFEADAAGAPEASGSGSKEGERPAAGKTSRGFVGGRSADITTLAWLSSVKVGNRRDDSSGPASGGESGTASRMQSRSRPPSVSREPGTSRLTVEGRSESRERERDRERGEDDREIDSNQSLQEE